MRQLLLDLLPENPPRFDNFVVGANSDALTGLMAWLAPDNQEGALLLWGESGSGKTHLLRASEACYVDAKVCPALFADGGEGEPAEHFYAVDNVQALNAAGQIALFNLFNRLRAVGGRLLTAADGPPRQLRLREDLRTRLGSGLIYRLHALTDEEKISALHAQAAARALPLSREVIAYLIARAPRDMRSLSCLLAVIDRYSLEHQRPITLPLLRVVLHLPPSDDVF